MSAHGSSMNNRWLAQIIARWHGPGIVLATGILLSVPLLIRGIPASSPSSGHDATIALKWSLLFSQEFWEGNLYPHWLTGANNGFGSVAFYFYPPITYWTYSLLAGASRSWLAGDTILCLAFTLARILAGFSCYWWLRHNVSVRAALIASFFYMAAPYHLAGDLLIRTAAAETFAFIFTPIVFCGADLLREQPSKGVFVTAIGFSLLTLTHVFTALLCGAIAGVYVTAQYWRRPSLLFLFGAALIVGLGCDAFYWLPIVTLAKYTHLTTIFGGYYKYSRWFLEGANFRSSQWRLFLTILEQLLLCGSLLFLFGVTVMRSPSRGVGERWYAGLAAIAVAFFLMTGASAPIWASLPMLYKVQFPWRFMALITTLSAALFAIAIDRAANAWARNLVIAVALLGLAPAAWAIFESPFERGEARLAKTLLENDEKEYVPIWWTGDMGPGRFKGPELPATTVIADGKGDVERIHFRAGGVEAVVNAREQAAVIFRQMYFVDWFALVDGKPADAVLSPSSGLVSVSVPTGEHTVVLDHHVLPEQRLGLWISAAAFLLLLGGVWALSRLERRRASIAQQ